jgi:SAM-dependent methyltransferase
MSKPLITPIIRGRIDLFEPQNLGRARLRGWIACDDIPLERIDIAIGGKPWTTGIVLHERPDVRKALEKPSCSRPHLSLSGFDVTAPLPEELVELSSTVVEITPYTPSGARLNPLRTYFCDYEELKKTPQPPAQLRDKVGGRENFIQVAEQLCTLIMTCLARYEPGLAQAEAILDWGCGCGRIITQMMKFVAPERLYGCDIDSAAIAWDCENVRGPIFTRVDPYPPTPYPDSSFDIVYGISVMTHLDEQTQILWLKELKRITRPGAILALSVIGERLRNTNIPASLAKEFSQKGFASFVPTYSDMLSEFSHANYYRETYHSLRYIELNWGRYFNVLEYIETKDQDIVMLRAL